MQYTYEFEMWHGEKEWCIAPFGIPVITQGCDIEDACDSAADLLRETVRDYLLHGETPPKPTFNNTLQHNGIRVVVSVDASLDDIGKVSASEAARLLGVSRARITTMVSNGLLEGWREGRNSWVTTASIEARLAEPHNAGRPKKALSA